MARTLIKKWLALLPVFFLSLAAGAQMSGSTAVPANDSAIAFASGQYRANSFLRQLFMGANYRNEWEQEVKVPVFHFTGSGFKIKDLGGGMQTKSLHLVDAAGKEWALRTVEKYITKASISPAMRNSLGRHLSQDLISAAFPYAAPLAGEVAHAAGIICARPQVFYVADDEALGSYRSAFAGMLCTLEERDPVFSVTETSEALLKNIRSDNRYRVQQEIYLQARLLDILIADWDRHADNWRWGLKDSAGYRFYYAAPRDRDWAFYYSKGWVPWLARITGSMPCLVSFTNRLKNVKMLSWKAWKMDQEFTNELSAPDWETIINKFQERLTDAAIEEAVNVLPASVYATNGATFVKQLESRRDALKKEVMKYYRFLSGEVVINGSDAEEKFVVSSKDKDLLVTVYSNDRKLYQRSFSSNETHSITLNGFGGDDVFEIDEKAQSGIRLKIMGGKGKDRYDLKGKVRTTVYDAKEETATGQVTNAKFIWQDDAASPSAKQ
jgi:hypothetical protein